MACLFDLMGEYQLLQSFIPTMQQVTFADEQATLRSMQMRLVSNSLHSKSLINKHVLYCSIQYDKHRAIIPSHVKRELVTCTHVCVKCDMQCKGRQWHLSTISVAKLHGRNVPYSLPSRMDKCPSWDFPH